MNECLFFSCVAIHNALQLGQTKLESACNGCIYHVILFRHPAEWINYEPIIRSHNLISYFACQDVNWRMTLPELPHFRQPTIRCACRSRPICNSPTPATSPSESFPFWDCLLSKFTSMNFFRSIFGVATHPPATDVPPSHSHPQVMGLLPPGVLYLSPM